jgi:hypothetical protein
VSPVRYILFFLSQKTAFSRWEIISPLWIIDVQENAVCAQSLCGAYSLDELGRLYLCYIDMSLYPCASPCSNSGYQNEAYIVEVRVLPFQLFSAVQCCSVQCRFGMCQSLCCHSCCISYQSSTGTAAKGLRLDQSVEQCLHQPKTQCVSCHGDNTPHSLWGNAWAQYRSRQFSYSSSDSPCIFRRIIFDLSTAASI